MPPEWVILIFVGGVVLGLTGRPIVIRMLRVVLRLKHEAKDLEREANKQDNDKKTQ